MIDSTDVAANVNYPSDKKLIRNAFKKVIKEIEKFNIALAKEQLEKIELEIDKEYETNEKVSSKKHFEITKKYLNYLYLKTYDELQYNEKYRETFGVCYDIIDQYLNKKKERKIYKMKKKITVAVVVIAIVITGVLLSINTDTFITNSKPSDSQLVENDVLQYDGNNPSSKKELKKAKYISLKNVESLEFLKEFENILRIVMGENAVGNIDDLSKLKNLEMITSANNSKITGDISSLKDLTKLQHIILNNSEVTGNIESLSKLNKLKNLSIRDTEITGDIESLSDLSELEVINAMNTTISGDIDNLSNFKNLRRIMLTNTKVTGDIKNFNTLSKLKMIMLENIKITGDINSINGLENLDYVNFAQTQITGDISKLRGLNNLTSLGLTLTKVTGDVGKLNNLENLNILDVLGTDATYSKLLPDSVSVIIEKEKKP